MKLRFLMMLITTAVTAFIVGAGIGYYLAAQQAAEMFLRGN